MAESRDFPPNSMETQPDTLPGLLFRWAQKEPDRVALREKEYGIWREITWKEYAQQVRFFALGLVDLGFSPGDRVAVMADNCVEWLFTELGTQCLRGLTVGIYPTSPVPELKYLMEDSQSQYFVAGDQEHVDKILEIRDHLPHLRKVIVIDLKGMYDYHDPILTSFEEVVERGRRLDQERPGYFEQLLKEVSPEDIAVVMYTSGTTGAPKGVITNHMNAIHCVEGMLEATPISQNDSFVAAFPMANLASQLHAVFIPLQAGDVINFAESLETVWEAIYEISPTLFLGVPRIYESIVSSIVIKIQRADWLKQLCYRWAMRVGRNYAERRLARMKIPLLVRAQYLLAQLLVLRNIRDKLGLLRVRIAWSGGSAASPELLTFFHGLGVPVLEIYGASETAGVTFSHRLDDIKPGTVGKPLKHVEFKITEKGEILQRRITDRFMGYLNKPEATRAALVDGWIHLGDTGYVDEEGNLVVLGRTKDIFVTRKGEVISPSEIENKLKFSPYINEAIIIGEGRPYVTALIQIEFDTVADWAQQKKIAYTTFRSLAENPSVKELIAEEVNRVNSELPTSKQIQAFELIPKELDEDDEELTPTRKVKRRIIGEKFGSLIERMYRG